MTYEIIGYESEPEFWTLKDCKHGETVKVDLVVGCELDEDMKAVLGDLDKCNIHEYFKWCRSLIGRKVEVKSLTTLTAIGNGIKLLEKEVAL